MTRLKPILALITLALLPFAAFGQDSQKRFIASETATLSAASGALTIQATSSSRAALPVAATLECDVAVDMIVSMDGTAATTTAATEVSIGRNRVAATVEAFSSSNVGAGTIIAQQTLAADTIGVFDLSGTMLNADAGTGENVTVRTSAVTGDCTMRLIWVEK